MERPRSLLLTNDDGIDSPGLRAVYEELSTEAEVTVVAPAADQSAVGRAISHEVEVTEHELGYAVHGTPVDCVVSAIGALDMEPDLVVSGCNKGANLGAYVLGRSGTVSAAVEAAFFGIPAIATSLYVPADGGPWREKASDPDDYVEAARAASYFVDRALETGVFEHADYLNVNAPLPGTEPAPMRLTEPATEYDMDASRGGNRIEINDHIWTRMANGDADPEPGTDRRAVLDGEISVTPLVVPHATGDTGVLSELISGYDPLTAR